MCLKIDWEGFLKFCGIILVIFKLWLEFIVGKVRFNKNIVENVMEKYNENFFICDFKWFLNVFFGRVYLFVVFISSYILGVYV